MVTGMISLSIDGPRGRRVLSGFPPFPSNPRKVKDESWIVFSPSRYRGIDCWTVRILYYYETSVKSLLFSRNDDPYFTSTCTNWFSRIGLPKLFGHATIRLRLRGFTWKMKRTLFFNVTTLFLFVKQPCLLMYFWKQKLFKNSKITVKLFYVHAFRE